MKRKMNRRKAITLIGLGGLGSLFLHNGVRRKTVQGYKSIMGRIPVMGREKEWAQIRGVFNFRSQAEEKEIISEIRKIAGRKREQSKNPLKIKLGPEDIFPLMKKVEKRRWEYAHELLMKLSSEERAKKAKVINDFFKENQKNYRIPAEEEIKDLVENGTIYTFRK